MKEYTRPPTLAEAQSILDRAERYKAAYVFRFVSARDRMAANESASWEFTYFGDDYEIVDRLEIGTGAHPLSYHLLVKRNGVEKHLRGLHMLIADLKAEARELQRLGILWTFVQTLRAQGEL